MDYRITDYELGIYGRFYSEEGAGHFCNQPTLFSTHFGLHERQFAIVNPRGGSDERIAQPCTMDEMDIGGRRKRAALG